MLSDPLARELYNEFTRIAIIDVHTHLDPHHPTARSLDDLLSYYHYPELALSTGMDRSMLAPGVDPGDRVRALFYHLLDFFPNTAPLQWLLEIAHAFLDFGGERLSFADCTQLADIADRLMTKRDWEQRVLHTCNIEKAFLNNDFDDPLEGIDAARYVPCLRADDLVFHFAEDQVRQRLARVGGGEVGDGPGLHRALAALFEHFARHQARAVNLVVPPDFAPEPVAGPDLSRALAALAVPQRQHAADGADAARLAAHGIFHAVVHHCQAFQLPLQLMIGVSHRAQHEGRFPSPAAAGGAAPMDRYAELFRSFPGATFCVSVISSGPAEELVNFSRIFANVVTNGFGGSTNSVPAALQKAVRCRLQAVPQTKQLGYYSAADKLEFILPQLNMYRRVLADALALDFVRPRIYTVWQAVQLGRLLLRDNARRIFDV
jgi:glucuronate isomerase